MKIISLPADMQAQALEWRRQGLRIGFVPTMGFLHAGHASLMRLARSSCDRLIVSIYVNPTQFAAGEDLSSYPRDVERDKIVCENEKVDVVFLPPNLYEPNHSVYVRESLLSQGLCGRSRPTHFEGVVTVVTKLFNIVQPHLAVFGQKDAQQAQIIRKLVADLNIPVEIILGPIYREADGLAMSSRNVYLSPVERVLALSLSRGLGVAEARFKGGERRASVIRDAVLAVLNAEAGIRIDYVAVVHPDLLSDLEILDEGALVAIAVYIGKTRLIDNCVLR